MKKIYFIVLSLFIFISLSANLTYAQSGAAWALTKDQRKAYLHYYSPIIFKHAEENTTNELGHDWITNFYYDMDDDFSNNGTNWDEADGKADYIKEGDHQRWQIRPTLYTSIIEFMEDIPEDDLEQEQKSIILLYQIYHAMDESHTHDWEIVEIRLDGVTGDPGSGETVRYVGITEHSEINARFTPDTDLNYQEDSDVADGKHIMLWQAEWKKDGGLTKAELHFVEDRWEVVKDLSLSNVDINGYPEDERKSFHYVFVDEHDEVAVNHWNAQTINLKNALSLAWGKDVGSVPMEDVIRITYELQDLADILPTHWDNGTTNVSWKTTTKHPDIEILMDTPIQSEDGLHDEVLAGRQFFINEAIDDFKPNAERHGYIRKKWFWGTYDLDYEEPWFPKGEVMDQHEYFAHSGPRKQGKQLSGDWYTDDSGGFDGRWVQLFCDNEKDDDCDDIPNDQDNCLILPNGPNQEWNVQGSCLVGTCNKGQLDSDADGYGDACDFDYNNDGMVGGPDLSIVYGHMFSAEPEYDVNNDGMVGGPDLSIVYNNMFEAPGPSGVECAGVVPCYRLPVIQAHFNEPYTAAGVIFEDTTMEDVIIDLLNRAVAGSKVKASLYKFDSDMVLDAIEEADLRGVKIEFVLDNIAEDNIIDEDDEEKSRYFRDKRIALKNILGSSNVHMCSSGGCIGDDNNHNKFWVFSEIENDENPQAHHKNVVVQLTANLNNGYHTKFNDMLVVMGDEDLYDAYNKYYADLKAENGNGNYADENWNSKLYTSEATNTYVHFSPDNDDDVILDALKKTSCLPGNRIRIASSMFRDSRSSRILDRCIELKAQQCDVEFVLRDSIDNNHHKDDLKTSGITVHYHDNDSPHKTHSKMVLIEGEYDLDGDEVNESVHFVFTGSSNLQKKSLRDNDEAILRVNDEDIFEQYIDHWNKQKNAGELLQ